jgi:hypothetical protein
MSAGLGDVRSYTPKADIGPQIDDVHYVPIVDIYLRAERADPPLQCAFARTYSSTNRRIAEDRLLCWRPSSIAAINFEGVNRCARAISLS